MALAFGHEHICTHLPTLVLAVKGEIVQPHYVDTGSERLSIVIVPSHTTPTRLLDQPPLNRPVRRRRPLHQPPAHHLLLFVHVDRVLGRVIMLEIYD